GGCGPWLSGRRATAPHRRYHRDCLCLPRFRPRGSDGSRTFGFGRRRYAAEPEPLRRGLRTSTRAFFAAGMRTQPAAWSFISSRRPLQHPPHVPEVDPSRMAHGLRRRRHERLRSVLHHLASAHGGRVNQPSVEIVLGSHRRMRDLPFPSPHNGQFPDEWVARYFAPAARVTPELAPGDALVLDHRTLHRTQVLNGSPWAARASSAGSHNTTPTSRHCRTDEPARHRIFKANTASVGSPWRVGTQGFQGRSYLAGHTYYQGTLIFSFRLAPMTSIPRLPRT